MLMRYLSLLLCVILHGVHGANNNNDITFREKAERYMSEYFNFFCYIINFKNLLPSFLANLIFILIYINYLRGEQVKNTN